jgi:type II secretory pathway pseudopilin PulG
VKCMKIFWTNGQTIIEAIVVIAVVVVLVTGLIAGTTTSLRASSAGRTKSQALKYAEQAFEYVRNLRDAKWTTFQAYSGFYCLGNETNALLTSTSENCPMNITTPEGTFSRRLEFVWDGEKMTVKVSVKYPDGSQTKDVSLTTYFTQWK